MYVFKTDHLGLDNELVCSSLRETISLAHSILQLPVVRSVGLGPWSLFLIHFSKSVVLVFVQLMFRRSYWLDLIDVASDISVRHSLTANSPILGL